MANNLLTISKITNEALMVLENELTFTSEVDRNYDDQFAVKWQRPNFLKVRKIFSDWLGRLEVADRAEGESHRERLSEKTLTRDAIVWTGP